jgi:hypothetical protein
MGYRLQMYLGRTLPLLVALTVGAVISISYSGENQPETAPTRDVDITYRIAQRGLPVIIERRRWLASRHLRRVDGPDKSASIFDQSSGELTLLNAANHTYRMLQGPAVKRMSPEEGVALQRGREFNIAGFTCVDWSWIDDTEVHTACLTPDGVLLRLIVDGRIVAEARSVLYTPQSSDLFEVPPGYQPALAPEGGPVD